MTKYFPPIDRAYRFLQTNRSNIIGNLWSTFGIDLKTNVGVIRGGNKMVINTSATDDADLGRPTAFEYFADRWWAICGGRVFKNSSEHLTAGFSEDASTGAQTDFDPDESDLCLFNERLWATTTDNLYSKESNTGDWTSRDALGSSVHKMAYFKKTDRLYYIDTDQKVSSISTGDVVANSTGDYFLDIGVTTGDLVGMVATTDTLFLGTARFTNSSSAYGLRGSVLAWDGVSGQITAEYPLNGAGVIAMCVHDNIPYVIDSFGRVLRFVGTGFQEIARLPLGTALLNGSTSSGSSFGKFVHHNGMIATRDNTILIAVNNLNNDNSGTIQENLASGIWELDLEDGNLTHKHPFSLKTSGSATITDFGQNRIYAIGALKQNTLQHDTSAGRSGLIAGAELYTNATATLAGIFIENPFATNGKKRGYFVTNYYDSEAVVEKWQRLWATFKQFIVSTDTLVFKYRTEEEGAVEMSITWVDTTHFTTTDATIASYANGATGFVGDFGGEVEILQGTGSGLCAHITGVVNNAGTYTVTIDTEATGVTTGTAKARVQKWIKMLPEATGTGLSYQDFPIAVDSPRIQIKCCYYFTTSDEFHKFILASESHLQANP